MEALGIDLKLFIAQAVNFLIVMFLLWKFAYNPVIGMLDERKKKIEDGLKNSDEANKSLARAEEEAKSIREKAFSEAGEIVKSAKESAASEANEILKKANDQADRVTKSAKDEAALAKDRVMKEAKGEIAGLINLALDKIIEKELSQEEKAKLTKKALQEL